MHRTAIGYVQMLHTEMNPGNEVKPRKYFWADFDPSSSFIDLADEVANSVEGALGVIATPFVEGTSFALSFDEKKADSELVSEAFIRALQRKLGATGEDELRKMVVTTKRASLASAMA